MSQCFYFCSIFRLYQTRGLVLLELIEGFSTGRSRFHQNQILQVRGVNGFSHQAEVKGILRIPKILDFSDTISRLQLPTLIIIFNLTHMIVYVMLNCIEVARMKFFKKSFSKQNSKIIIEYCFGPFL